MEPSSLIQPSDAACGSRAPSEQDLLRAAGIGFFPCDASPRFGSQAWRFEKRNYSIRYAGKADLAQLEELECQCWPPLLAARKDILLRRLEQYPEGQLVLEKDSKVVGAIYSQRLQDAADLQTASVDNVLDLHAPDGSVVQLLAVNILPEWQHLQLGDQLLEFALLRSSVAPVVQSVVAVTLCRDYKNRSETPIETYIHLRNEAGKLADPVLRFHELHGARIEGLIPNYRPLDSDNRGYGVLVRYDIHNRRRDEASVVHGASYCDPAHDPGKLLEEAIKGLLGKSREQAFAMNRPFMEMGLDSADLLVLNEHLCSTYGCAADSTFFFRYNTVERVVDYLKQSLGGQGTAPSTLKAKSSAQPHCGERGDVIAVVGIGCRLPGGINHPRKLWEFLCNNRSAIAQLPADRWSWPPDIDPAHEHRGIDKGGFLDDVACFDASFFRISPKEAEIMDPQQRILLELAWHTLEDAGHPPSRVAGTATGVFMGASGSDYNLLLQNAGSVEAHFATGTAMAILPNRLSYFYDLHGPSLLIDTACSSSLVAVHQAVNSLRCGDCTQALVGGINVICDPSNSIAYYRAGMLSPEGRCRTFDQQANGYVRSEGAVMVFLKPLQRALEDRDRIYAVIRGSATNHGAQSGGLTVPNPAKQAALLVRAYEDAGVSPQDVTYIEAHGTGTSLGDPIEVKGLHEAFQQLMPAASAPSRPWCGLGSLKTNFGHLEAAAGLAGFVKAALSIYHGRLLANGNFNELNHRIDLAESPFYVLTENRDWTSEAPRMAGVSSFGSGGTNAHALLEEYRAEIPACRDAEGPWLFVLSARDQQRLHSYAEGMLRELQEDRSCSIDKMTRTLQLTREAMEERLAIVAASADDLIDKLGRFCAGEQDLTMVYQRSVKAIPAQMKILLDTRFADTAVDEILREKDLCELAVLWTCGFPVDWSKLHGPESRAEASLPGYPFARERYWISRSLSNGKDLIRRHALHPLVHENTSTVEHQRFTSSFSGHEFFFQDHVIAQRKLLPAAAYLEMVREACELSKAGTVAAIRNIVWVEPLTVSGAAQKVDITLHPEQDGIRYEVSMADPIQAGPRTTFSQGSVSPSSVPVHRPPATDIKVALEQCPSSIDQDQIYFLLAKYRLEYGAAFQTLQFLRFGPSESVARFKLAEAAVSSAASFSWHPCAVDAGLQAATLVSLLGDEDSAAGAYLPFAVDSVEIYDRPSHSGFVHVRPRRAGANQLRSYDLDLLNEDGMVMLRFSGLSLRRLDQQENVVYAKLEWHDTPLVAVASMPEPELHVLAGAISETQLAALRHSFGANLETLRSRSFSSELESPAEVFLQVFERLRSIMAHRPVSRCRVAVFVPDDGDRHHYAALTGLFKTARQEDPRVEGKVVFVGSSTPAETLCDECRGWDGEEVRYGPEGKRYVCHAVEVKRARSDSRAWIKPGGVYWITGGAGGLGRIFAEHIGGTADVRLILSGRTECSPAIGTALETLSAHHIRAEYMKADLSSYEDTAHALKVIRERYGNLSGIVHAAGTIEDAFIVNKTEDQIRRVFAAKASGLMLIDELTQDMPLDFVALFSSTAAVLGSVGQADYAGANAFMDAFAAHRNELVRKGKRYGRTVSINWPLWHSGGMTMPKPAMDNLFKTFGLLPLETSQGLEAFSRALQSGEDQWVVLHGKVSKLRDLILRHDPQRLPTPVTAGTAADNRVNGPEHARARCSPGQLTEDTVRYLKQQLSSTLKLAASRIDENAALKEYGIDSMLVLQLTNALEKSFGTLPKTLFFEYQTIAELAEYFIENHREQVAKLSRPEAENRTPESETAQPVQESGHPGRPLGAFQRSNIVPWSPESKDPPFEIAIIGLSGRYPQAPDLEAFWRNLRAGKDCIIEIPPERWDYRRFYDPDKTREGKSYSKWGGFIDDVDKFDPLFFGIFPREAEIMEPQERLFLECAWAALEDAAYTPESLQNDSGWAKVGVYVGVMYEEYQLYGVEESLKGNPVALNGLPAGIANRVSHACNFHGPSMVVDTMCSSSLTAVHLACHSLQNGECDVALAGGVNVSIHPNKYLYLSQGRFVSSRGRCESFGEGAEGYVPGEGVGAVLLKPKHKAVADGDHIYAVIRATSINHGGKTNGYTVPNPRSQANAIGEALMKTGIPARAISYLEAHGTGTSLGDPIEIAGLLKAFSTHTKERQFCSIGSVKSNIGHCEAAAGIAGLTKVLLQMKHGELVPSLHSEVLNPNINFRETPFFVQQRLQEWQRPVLEIGGTAREWPRTAGISSFGAGGSNAHVIVQEYIPHAGKDAAVVPLKGQAVAIVPLSALNEERLKALGEQLLRHLRDREPDLLDVAYTLQVGRKSLEHRVAFVVSTLDGLKARLEQFIRGDDEIEGCHQGHIKTSRELAAFFTSDEELRDAVEKWIKKGKHTKVAQLWTRGIPVDWNLLYDQRAPRRISLPTYPLSRERYWVPQTRPEEPQKRPTAAGKPGPACDPFVAQSNMVPEHQEFKVAIKGDEHFVSVHAEGEEKSLLGLVFLHLGKVGGELTLRRELPALRNVVWSKPAQINGHSLELKTLVFRDGGDFAYKVYSENGHQVVHHYGELVLGGSLAPSAIDARAVEMRLGVSERKEDVAAFVHRRDANLGPASAFLQTFQHNEQEMLARLALPGQITEEVSHPALVNLAWHLMDFWETRCGVNKSSPLFPLAAEEVKFSECHSRELLVHVIRKPGGARLRQYDVTLGGTDGTILIQCRDLTALELRDMTDIAL